MNAYNSQNIALTFDLLIADPLGLYSDFYARLHLGSFTSPCLEFLEEVADFLRTEQDFSTMALAQLVLRYPPYGRLEASDISGRPGAVLMPLPVLMKQVESLIGFDADDIPTENHALDLMRRFGYQVYISDDHGSGWLAYANPFGFSSSLQVSPIGTLSGHDTADDDTGRD